MSTVSQGVSGSTPRTRVRPALGRPAVRGNHPAPQRISPEQLLAYEIRRLIGSVETLRSQHEESSAKREVFYALVGSLDRLGLGTSGGDADRRLQPTRSAALFITLERFKEKLQDVSDRIENGSYTGSDEDVKVVSRLMDEIRAAIADCQSAALPPSLTNKSPPPAPKACFGRDDLIEEVVALAEGLTPVTLIGVGGIGKTSIALTVLHHYRVKQRFGENRRFIRCDQFPATVGHLLNRLSKVIEAGIENPEDLTPLRPFLSSKETILVLDNAESILDPQGTDAAEICALVEELSELPTLCLCITSRTSTIPPECKTIEVPVLSMDAACRAFHHIYKCDKGSNLVDGMLEQIEFHPLSITLLATVAHQNKWGIDRLAREWEKRQTSVLQTRHKKSLAAAIELSLASPIFQEFGPDARALLGAVAFFPRGVDENNIDWLFPTISNGITILDGFCTLSLTSRSNGFITMPAPLRDYLSPEDPKSSPLLCTAKERYFIRMAVYVDPHMPDFKEGRWIRLEDVNAEHLLDVFTTIDGNADDVWIACANFMTHLCWHKPRLTLLGPKIEGIPDDHRRKTACLIEFSRLLGSIGNYVECKGVLSRALKLEREQGSKIGVVRVLRRLFDVNWHMGLYDEGIQQGKEALETYERLGRTAEQAEWLIQLAWSLWGRKQLDPAEEAASRVTNLPEKGERDCVPQPQTVLGDIYRSKDEIEKAIHYFEETLRFASTFDFHSHMFLFHSSLAWLFLDGEKLDDAHFHAGSAKSYAYAILDNTYSLGRVMMLQALVWYEQQRLEEAKSEALCAAEIFEKLGSSWGIGTCGKLLGLIQKRLDT